MDRAIKLGEELFSFESQAQWVNHAQGWFAGVEAHRNDYICLDSIGRVCRKGAEFMRATREDTYPVTVYMLD